MTRVIRRRHGRALRSQEGRASKSYETVLGVLGSVVVFVVGALVSMGVPRASSFEDKPEGASLYRVDNLECWDKVVCCDPGDESTCTTIPNCRIVE